MDKKIKRILILLVSCMMLVCLCSCRTYDNFKAAFFPDEKDNSPSVKIGVFEPLTGSDAADAAEEIAGIELAHELFPKVLGARVELVYADNQSSAQVAVEVAQNLVDGGSKVILGSYKSLLSLAGSDIFAAAKVPAVGITCKNPIITQTNDYYFRVCYVDSYEGDSAAHYIFDGLGQSKAAVLVKANDDYEKNIVDEFQTTLQNLTGNEDCVTVIEYPDGIENFYPYFMQLYVTGASTVFFPSSAADGDRIIRMAKGYNFSFDWLGTSQWDGIINANPDYLLNNETYLNGVCYVVDFDEDISEGEMTIAFRNAYKKKFGDDAVPTEAAALGFDAYLLALEGIKLAGSYENPANIALQMKSIYEMPAATGNISLNVVGDPIKDATIERIKNGISEDIFLVTPSWGE